ncbi:hypothetical protein M8J77_000117 [Diaphorina citri]|nr:hypothetical protein M8J77_000117 [Diaphorina citri]
MGKRKFKKKKSKEVVKAEQIEQFLFASDIKSCSSEDKSSCLKNVTVTIPKAVIRGGTATLKCNYNLEDEALYTMKWYRNGREFYRFTPREKPQTKIFPIVEVPLQIANESNANRLILNSVQLEATGRYSCEVSADAPSFQTSIVTSNMDIVVLPQTRPEIEGFRSRYRVGDVINATCKSYSSKPPANLTWSLNGEPVPPQFVSPLTVSVDPDGAYETSISSLRLKTSRRDFIGQNLRLRCTASIHDVYWKTTEKATVEDIKHRETNHRGVETNHRGVETNHHGFETNQLGEGAPSFLAKSSTVGYPDYSNAGNVGNPRVFLDSNELDYNGLHGRRAASTTSDISRPSPSLLNTFASVFALLVAHLVI